MRIGIAAGSMKLPWPVLLCCSYNPTMIATSEKSLVLIAVMVVVAIGKEFENGEHLETNFGVESIRSKTV
jgi:hypothetical protein